MTVLNDLYIIKVKNTGCTAKFVPTLFDLNSEDLEQFVSYSILCSPQSFYVNVSGAQCFRD